MSLKLELTDLNLRKIQNIDLPILCKIYGSTRTEELDNGTNWDNEQKKKFIEHQFFAQHDYYQKKFLGADFYLIEKQDIAVGRLYIDYFFENKEIRIIDITILPEWRNKGIGSLIFKEIINKARNTNLKVTIHVESFNPAKELYKRLGFIKISETNGIYHLMEWSPK